jgi:hypothetical protein
MKLFAAGVFGVVMTLAACGGGGGDHSADNSDAIAPGLYAGESSQDCTSQVCGGITQTGHCKIRFYVESNPGGDGYHLADALGVDDEQPDTKYFLVYHTLPIVCPFSSGLCKAAYAGGGGVQFSGHQFSEALVSGECHGTLCSGTINTACPQETPALVNWTATVVR